MEAKRESHNLGELLGIKEADSSTSCGGGGLTLLAILSDKPPSLHVNPLGHQVQSNAVVSEQPSISRAQSNRTLLDILREEQTSGGGSHHHPWSLLKNIIRLHHHHHNRRSSNSRAIDDASHVATEEAPARMSLMALLEENDRQTGSDGFGSFGHVMYADEEQEINFNNCCVCMMRHKGAAFIPCGHTFCRLCSRELWVQRGNCPLCNSYILEILDIF